MAVKRFSLPFYLHRKDFVCIFAANNGITNTINK